MLIRGGGGAANLRGRKLYLRYYVRLNCFILKISSFKNLIVGQLAKAIILYTYKLKYKSMKKKGILTSIAINDNKLKLNTHEVKI